MAQTEPEAAQETPSLDQTGTRPVPGRPL
jgi:hypothetical protein